MQRNSLIPGAVNCAYTPRSGVRVFLSSQVTRIEDFAKAKFEPSHEITALFVLRKLILQTCMRSHSEGLDVWFSVEPFVYFHTSRVRIAKALARLYGCADSPEPSLIAYVISTIISWAGSFNTGPSSLTLAKVPNSNNFSFFIKICHWKC